MNDTLRGHFPNIDNGSCVETSPEDSEYNCIAWALGIKDEWWQPDMIWPDDLPSNADATTVVALFEKFGYRNCASADFEPDKVKIAIYATGSRFSHVAIQKENSWSSKLGPGWDISHEQPEMLEGSSYGYVQYVMERSA